MTTTDSTTPSASMAEALDANKDGPIPKPPLEQSLYRYVGPRLKEARVARGLSAREAGDTIGCSKTAIYAMETGRSRPDLDRIALLADIYTIPIKQLLPPHIVS